MVFLALWILFGIGCAIAAANKNRSAAGWFFLGMLLGPFGLLFILLLSPLGAMERAPEWWPPDTPWPLRSPPSKFSSQAETTSEVSLDNETKKCPACAEIIKLEALKCRYCLEALDPQEVDRQVEARRAVLSDDLAKRTAGKKQCPRCYQWDVHRAVIEGGGQGDWCPHCQISLQKMATLPK